MVDYLGQGISVSVLEPENSGGTFSGLFLQAAVSMLMMGAVRSLSNWCFPWFGWACLWIAHTHRCIALHMLMLYCICCCTCYLMSTYIYIYICLWYMHVLRFYHSWLFLPPLSFFMGCPESQVIPWAAWPCLLRCSGSSSCWQIPGKIAVIIVAFVDVG